MTPLYRIRLVYRLFGTKTIPMFSAPIDDRDRAQAYMNDMEKELKDSRLEIIGLEESTDNGRNWKGIY